MILTVKTNDTLIYDCESVANSVGNKAVIDNTLVKHNVDSLIVTTNKDKPNIGYNRNNIPDLTGEHLRLWYTSISYTNTDIKSNGGIMLYATDNSNQTGYWYIGGNDTYYGGWLNVIIDMDSVPAEGTVDVSDIKEIGITHNYVTSTLLDRPNVRIDFIRYGDDIECYGDNVNMSNIVHATSAYGVGYGMIINESGVNHVYGGLNIGSLTTPTMYDDKGIIIVFTNANVRDDLYGITYIGDESGSSEFSLTNSVIIGDVKKYYLHLDDSNIGKLILYGNTFVNAGDIKLLGNNLISTTMVNLFYKCGTIYPNGARFENNSLNNTTSSLGSLFLADNTHVNNTRGIIYSSYDNKYALYLTDTVDGIITLDGHTFDGSGIDIYWGGITGTLIIRLVNGSNPVTYNTAGGVIDFLEIADSDTTALDNVNDKLIVLEETISNLVNANSNNINNKLTSIEDGILQVMGEIITEVQENETLIVSNGQEFKITI